MSHIEPNPFDLSYPTPFGSKVTNENTGSHINEEWESRAIEEFRGYETDFGNGILATKSKSGQTIMDYMRTLYLQALEQGRTEGRQEAITVVKHETFRLKAPNEVARDYYIMDTVWSKCQEAIVKELEALSKLRKV